MTKSEKEKSRSNLEASRKAYHPSELPVHLREAIKEARMDNRHGHLNELLKD
jgi:hypothetical protein